MKAFERLCHAITMIMSALATIQFLWLTTKSSVSAPQYAAEAAGMCAMVIIPYVFTRSVARLADLSKTDSPTGIDIKTG